jgi:murein DD-endopeptidase MepM/ murein hydrolase activator NlpD
LREMTPMIRSLTSRLRRTLHSAIPAAALAATAVSASAGTLDGIGAPAQLLSLKMTLTENLVFIGAAPCFIVSTIQGTGKSAQLGGNFTVSSTDCLNPHGTFDPNNGNAFSFASQSPGIVITTAAGHKIYASYSGTVRRQGAMTGNFVILGGTGPYYGVTGGGLLLGYSVMSPSGTSTGALDGFGTLQLAQ